MKKEYKLILPHVVAILVFAIVSILFCRPAIEGNVLDQHDIVGWKGIAQNAFDYKDKNGHFPLWNPNLFGGMPNYLIAMEGKSILPDHNKFLSLGLPQPINFFFLSCVCFYILCLVMRLRVIVAIFGALAFAFATYNPVIIASGHITKMFAIAYMPLLLAGILATFEKRYWLGLGLTTLGTYVQVAANHPQVSFYFFIIALGISIAYFITWVMRKDLKHAMIAFGITAVAAIVGMAANSLSFMTTREYAKASIRGGKTINIKEDSVTLANQEGLDTSYAFEYSFIQPEPLVVLMPNAFGGSSSKPAGAESNVVSKLASLGIPEGQGIQLAEQQLPRYWGGLEINGGPPYAGVLVVLLALLGFVLVKHPLRWGLLGVTVLAILMSWGRFLPGFNNFLFDTLPLYNKFRAPSMAVMMLQITLPVMAVMAVQQLFYYPGSRDFIKANFKKILYTLGGLTAFLGLLYFAMDYSSVNDRAILENNWDNSGTPTVGRAIVSGLKEDRQGMFGAQILRTLGFALLVLGLIWAYMRNILKALPVVIILALVTLIDLVVVGKEYLGSDSYMPKDDLETMKFAKSEIDNYILSDTTKHFRVYNEGRDRFSAGDYKVSVFHKAVGGYHPAKLRIYNDVIEYYFYRGRNPQVINMLNVKYIITQNPQTGQQMLEPNPNANGPAWFVKNVRIAADDVEEIKAIGSMNVRDTAIISKIFAGKLVQPQWDSSASIQLTKFDNDEIEYATNSSTPQFAVFSEIYYPYGWNAYIDGQKVDYVKANYILRGLSVPAGKHNIKFVFEPATFKTGMNIAFIGSFLVAIFVLGGLFMEIHSLRKKNSQLLPPGTDVKK